MSELKQSPLIVKSFAFSVDIVNLFKKLNVDKKEFILSKQLVRSGTSIGANIEEANGAVSDADFKNKLSIAYKESRETTYWLRLLNATDYIDKKDFENYNVKCEELSKMLRASINTMNKINS
jgi:four helix bundle protein